MRVKKLNEEKHQLFGDADSEEGSDGKRLTRARAKTGPSVPEKRTKLPSVGDSGSLSETEPTPTRSTRSRVSATPAMPTLDLSSSPQAAALLDEEDNMAFRKNSLNLLNKISNLKSAVAIQKCLTEDASKILKHPMDIETIRRRIESGETKSFTTIQKDLSRFLCNVIIANPGNEKIGELAVALMAVFKEEVQKSRASPRKKIIVRFRKLKKNQNFVSGSEVVEYSCEILPSLAASYVDKKNVWKHSGRKRRQGSDTENSSLKFPFRKTKRATKASAKEHQKAIKNVTPDIISENKVPVVCEYEFVHLAATEQLKHLFVDSKAPSKMGVNNEEGTISNIPVSQELTDLVHSALEGTKEDEKVKSPTSTPPAPALAKLLELPVITPGMPLPEISSVKPNDISPLKNATRPTTRGRSKDRTVKESPNDEIIVPIVQEVPSAKKEENDTTVTNAAPASLATPKIETNGGESETPIVGVADEAISDKIEKTPAPTLAKLLELLVISPGMPLPEISSVQPNDVSPQKNASRPTTRGRSKDQTVKESPNDEIIVPIVQEGPTAKKEENDTTVTNAAPASLATSKIETNGGESETLIVAVADEATSDKIEKTPDEKNDNKSQDEKNEEGETKMVDDETTDINHCKSPTTNAHFNDVNAVLVQPSDSQTQIRYNENVTPTSGEQAETPWQTFNPETPSVIPNVVLPEEKKVKECESSRTSPENTKVKSNQEVVPEAKPKLRVYSGRPPSPISHFEEFPDFGDKEEDPELAAIENNVNKNDSSSPITSTKKIVMRFTRVSKSNYKTFTGKLMPEYKCEFVDQENKNEQPKVPGGRRKRQRSVSETSVADVFPLENKSRVTRSSYQQVNKKSKHRFSPDIVSATKTKSGMNFKIHGLAGKAKSRLVKQLRTRVPRVSLLRM